MQKIYELSSWCSNFLIVSLLAGVTSFLGLLVLGVIPSLKTGILIIQQLVYSQSQTAPSIIVAMYFKEWKKQIKATIAVNFLFFLLIVVNLSMFLLNSSIHTSLFTLWCGALTFVVTILFFQAVLLQSKSQILLVLKYLIDNLLRVICLLLVMIFWAMMTFMSTLPIWILSIGLLCYLVIVIRDFGTAKQSD